MPAGLQIFDQAGNTLLDMTTRISRQLGQFYVSSSGSSYIPGLSSMGTPYIVVIPAGALWGDGVRPVTKVSGDSIVYTYYTVRNQHAVPCTIYYGVY